MTDHVDSLDDPSDDELATLAQLLSRADTWDEPPRHVEDDVLAAIALEAPLPSAPASLADHRSRRSTGRLLAAAAAVLVIVVGAAVLTRGGDDGATFALEGTGASPDASATGTVAATPAGLKILLDAEGLAGAPEGYMYEAWVGDGTIGVSAGTFHLRGGHGPIELWAGVTDASFRLLWVTLEPVDDDASSSRDARLRGEFSLTGD